MSLCILAHHIVQTRYITDIIDFVIAYDTMSMFWQHIIVGVCICVCPSRTLYLHCRTQCYSGNRLNRPFVQRANRLATTRLGCASVAHTRTHRELIHSTFYTLVPRIHSQTYTHKHTHANEHAHLCVY